MKKNVLKVLGACLLFTIIAYSTMMLAANTDDPRFLYNTPTTSTTMNA